MPARTVGQLAALLSSYTPATGIGPAFTECLNQVLERVYSMGLWQDMTYEEVLPLQDGRVALPPEADTILYYLFNDAPLAKIRPLWYDYKSLGRTEGCGTTASGLVDDGFHVGSTDLDEAGDYSIYFTGTENFNGLESFRIDGTVAGVRTVETLTPAAGDGSASTAAVYDAIHSITWSNVSDPRVNVGLTNADIALDVDSWATILGPEGVLRTRRYRVPGSNPDTEIRALLTRRHVPVSADSDIVYLGNSNALKHGLLALTAEDNADLEKADIHWEQCRKIFDQELDSGSSGTARTINVDIWGGQAPVQNLM